MKFVLHSVVLLIVGCCRLCAQDQQQFLIQRSHERAETAHLRADLEDAEDAARHAEAQLEATKQERRTASEAGMFPFINVPEPP